jgi:glycosyltransferase involved in cell wall biosynthesis
MAELNNLPLVTAVIPTYRRPEMILAAVKFALDQTYKNIEVLVVVDGPYPPTEELLATIHDERVRVVVNEVNVGLAEVKNIAARHARGEYIALLDDDDEWYPTKIEKQVAVALELGGDNVMVFSQFLDKTDKLTRVQPYSFPRGPHKFSESIFCERCNLQCSTWFISTALIRRVPFIKGLRIEDIDWLLRATADENVKVGKVEEVLSVYNNMDTGARITSTGNWETSYLWGMTNRKYFTPRAFSYFIATFCIRRAKQNKVTFRTYLFLISTALFLGSASPGTFMYFFGYLIFSDSRRRAIKEFLKGRRT